MSLPSVATRVERARRQVGKGVNSGYCETFTRSLFGFPARYGSARLAYLASKADGPIHHDYDAPAGVPLFADILSGPNAAYDHVWFSVGGGYSISTSAGPGRTVAKVRTRELVERWGMRYHGWAEFYHGRRVWSPPPRRYPAVRMHERSTLGEIFDGYRELLLALGFRTPSGVNSPAGLMQVWLADRGLDVGPVDGDFGPRSKRALQVRLSDRELRRPYTGPITGVWGPVGSQTRIAAAALLNDRITIARKG